MPNRMKKTQEQINAEIAALREIKPRVRRYSAFGDDHHHSIDVQIEALEHNLTYDDIMGENFNSDDYDSAYEAISWREGDDDEVQSLVEDWKSLVP